MKKEQELQIDDLMQFHLRWREFRDYAVKATGNNALDPCQRETLRWLVAMADRVSEDDITTRQPANPGPLRFTN